MSLPKVIFKKCDINQNLDSLVWYANPHNSVNSPLNFYKLLLKQFPELEGRIQESMSPQEIYEVLVEVVKPILSGLYESSNDDEIYQNMWDIVNDDILRLLEDVLNTKWEDDRRIESQVGLFPVLSRDVMDFWFEINYGSSKDLVIATAIHEMCHMLYFKKWREIFPNCKEEEFDNPHIVWYLSEAMIDPLINNEKFKRYTSESLESYTVFYETKIDGKSVIEILRDYVSSYPIEEAIKKSYEFFLEHESEIKGF